MGIFDEDLVVISMDKEVIKQANFKNGVYYNNIAGFTSSQNQVFSINKDHRLKMIPKTSTVDIVISEKHGPGGKRFSLQVSTMTKYRDENGLDIYKIMDPSSPVFILSETKDIPDCFILDVPKGTKEVTFVSCFDKPLTKLPKVKGNVKITYINRSRKIALKKGEKINISKWWDGYYENR